jgi:hypothetical protein
MHEQIPSHVDIGIARLAAAPDDEFIVGRTSDGEVRWDVTQEQHLCLFGPARSGLTTARIAVTANAVARGWDIISLETSEPAWRAIEGTFDHLDDIRFQRAAVVNLLRKAETRGTLVVVDDAAEIAGELVESLTESDRSDIHLLLVSNTTPKIATELPDSARCVVGSTQTFANRALRRPVRYGRLPRGRCIFETADGRQRLAQVGFVTG